MQRSKLKVKNQTWRKVKLREVDLDISDGNYSSKYPKKDDFVKWGVPFIRADNFKDGKVTHEDMRFISLEKHRELKKGHLKRGDVLITTRGEIGRVAYIDDDFIDANINAQIVRINTKDTIYPRFFFYYLLNLSNQGYFQSIQTGTALQQLPVGVLKNIEISFPEDFDNQKRIADILSAFDDKIEVNNKIIKNLEEMAAAIFKEWFVKFRFPGHEKAKSRSERSSATGIKMVNSELGKIPGGWEVRKMGEITTIEYGRGPSTKEFLKTGYPVYGANGIIGYSEKYQSKESQIIVGCRGVVGSLFKTLPKSSITHNSLIIRLTNFCTMNYLFWILKNANLQSVVGGSAQLQITIKDLSQLPILLAEKDIQERFEAIVKSMEKKRLSIYFENQKLSSLRDLLLPKLMNGEIKV